LTLLKQFGKVFVIIYKVESLDYYTNVSKH